MIRDAVLLDGGVEVDADGVGFILAQGEFVNGARERLVDFEHDGSRERSSIFDHQILADRHSWDSLFPNVLEVKLGRRGS